MDLGIAGRKAIVCASSRGLGRACAERLAEAGCEVVINGRNRERLEATAADMRKATGAKIIAVAADVATAGRPEGAVRRLPGARHPGQQQCRPAVPRFPRARPPEDDRRRDRQHGGGDRAHPEGRSTRWSKRKFGRIVNITSGSVKMPLVGLDLSSGARAGLTAFMAGVARSVAGANVTINFLLPGAFDTDRLRSNIETTAKKRGIPFEQATAERVATIPAKRFGTPDEFGAACAFLCSAHAGYITGQNLLIDGGAFPGAF